MSRLLISHAMLLFSAYTWLTLPAHPKDSATDLPTFPTPVLKPGLYKPDPVACTKTALDKYLEAMKERIYGNWEPPSDCQTMKYKLHFFIDKNGCFSNISLINGSDDRQANFAALEAVYESSGFRKTTQSEVLEFELTLDRLKKQPYQDCSKLLAKDKGRTSNFVVWHLIPLEALQCNHQLNHAMVHSKSNLRRLADSDVNSPEIEQARTEWNLFLHSGKNLKTNYIKENSAKMIQQYFVFLSI